MEVGTVTETRALAALMSLTGRSAVVTGGAAGIGNAICRRLAEAGAHVVVADRQGARAAADGITAEIAGARLSAFDLDVSDSSAISDCVRFAVAGASGRLDIWVNNAGIYPAATALETTDEMWDQVHTVNLRGAFIGAREAARHMVAAGQGGVIINIASTAALKAAGVTHYAASKHGMHGMTKTLAKELGADGIRVLSIAPGMIQTPGMVVRTKDVDFDVHAQVAGRVPLRRVGEPDDIAGVVLFAASDLARYMTGSVLVVDGGEMVI
jgi:NAD(P)-dependent dehydrogenase (short-subunit alcohol dehydrogenase family)